MFKCVNRRGLTVKKHNLIDGTEYDKMIKIRIYQYDHIWSEDSRRKYSLN